MSFGPINTTDKQVVYSNQFMEVQHTCADFGSFTKDYYVVSFGQRVGIVAVREGCILLVKQYRFLIKGCSWEIPGGNVDESETPEDAAIRECIEETGVSAKNLKKLIAYYPGLDNVRNKTSIFFTDDVESGAFLPDNTEVISIKWTPITQCLEMIKMEEILDALTIGGILAYKAGLIDSDRMIS